MTADNPVASTPDLNVSARRNARLLSAAFALGGSAAPIAISMGGLAGLYLLGDDKSLATAPVTGYNVGVALGALPAAMIMARIGRRLGFMGGATIGVGGALLSCWAIMQGNFWLFCIGMACSGIGGSFTQQYRFAAADQGTDDFKAKAISWVLVGGLFAAVIGPQAAIWFGDYFAPIQFAGAYVAGAVLIAGSILVLSFLSFEKPASRAERQNADTGRPISEIISQPKFIVAVLCAVGTYSLMSFVMTGAPLAMVSTGITMEMATTGIMFHVMAMFAPSFFTGNLIVKYGKERVVAAGMIILGCCAVVALLGLTIANFWVSLILLGIGWNFGFIGATAMLTETYTAAEKSKAQGANDLILFSSVAFASLMSGQTLNAWGWEAINWMVFPVIIACLLGLLWLKNHTAGQAVA